MTLPIVDNYIVAAHYSELEFTDWQDRFPNFKPREVCCQGTLSVRLFVPALDAMQRIRNRLGFAMIVTSAYRSPEHNKRVGGSPKSQHVQGRAFDVAIESAAHGDRLERLARDEGAKGLGRYPRRNFIHLDWRKSPRVVRWVS